jgi:hypothetical protein
LQKAASAAAGSAAAAKADKSPAASLANGSFVAKTPAASSASYQKALNNLLAKGVAPATAMQRAATAATISSTATRADKTPAASLANGSFAAKTPAASSASYQNALNRLLAKGVDPATAMKRAASAATATSAATRVDNTPSASLANGTFTSKSPVAASPAYQSAVGSLLAKGIPPAEAMQRANAAAAEMAAAVAADAKNPNAGFASGNLVALNKAVPSSTVDSSLGRALARGVSVEEAMKRASQAEAEIQQVIKKEFSNPLSGFSTGKAAPLQGGREYDQALANAIGRGVAPADAQAVARQSIQKMPREKQTIVSSLASGKHINELLGTNGTSPLYEKALGKALARGLSVEAAVAYAKRVEAVGVLRLPVPTALAKQISLSGSAAVITTAANQPLPGWLRYDATSKSFVICDAPAGALPIEVAVTVNNNRTVLRISEQLNGKQGK